MKILVNGIFQDISANTSIKDFMNINYAEHSGIAVALDSTVIPRSQWEKHVIQDHQKITIIKATQGG